LLSKLTSVTLHPAVDTGYRYTYGLFISPPNPKNMLYATSNNNSNIEAFSQIYGLYNRMTLKIKDIANYVLVSHILQSLCL